MWELLLEVFKQMAMSSLSAGVGYGLGQITGAGGTAQPPARGSGGGMPPLGMVPPGGSTARPMSMNSLGGLTGSPPAPTSGVPGEAEGRSSGTGFASLSPIRRGGFELPRRPGV